MEFQRMLLGLVVFGVVIGMLFFSKPSVTGFVPTETHAQQLDINVDESQRFILTSTSGEALKISALALSGSVAGPGLVNVYLTDSTNKWLVFSNKKKRGSSMEQITGLAVSDLNIEPGEHLYTIETLPDDYVTESGAFTNECRETCILNEELFNSDSLYLDVIIEPGTTLHISEIIFASVSE